MNRLQEIKNQVNNGHLHLDNVHWLIKTVEHQKKIIWNLREKTRFTNYMKLANENLELIEKLQKVEEQRDFYKQAYKLSKTRS